MNTLLKNKGIAKNKTVSLYREDVEALEALKEKFGLKHSSIIQQLIGEAYNKYIVNDKDKC